MISEQFSETDTQNLKEEISQAINRAFEIGVDVKPFSDIIIQADEMKRNRNLSGAKELLNKTLVDIEGAVNDKRIGLIGFEMVKFDSSLKKATAAGIEIGDLKKVKELIKELNAQSKYEEMLSTITENRKLLKEMISNWISEKHTWASESYSQFTDQMGDGEVPELKLLYDNISKAFNEKNLVSMKDNIGSFELILEQSRRKHRILDLRNRYENMKKKVGSLEDIPLDVQLFKGQMEALKPLFDGGELDTIEKELYRLDKEIGAYIYKEIKPIISATVTEIENLQKRLAGKDIDDSQTQELLRKGLEYLSSGDLLEALLNISKTRDFYLERTSELKRSKLIESVEIIEDMIEFGKELGLEVSSMVAMLDRGMKLMEEGNNENAQNLFNETIKFLSPKVDSKRQETFNRETSNYEKLIAEADSKKMDTSSEKNILQELLGNYRSDRYSDIMSDLKAAMELVSLKLETWTELEKGKYLLNESKEVLDVSEEEPVLNTAYDKFKEGEYSEARSIASEMIKGLENRCESSQRGEIGQFIEGIEEYVNNLKKEGLNPLSVEIHLYKAKYSFERKNYDEAYEIAKKAKTAGEELKREFYTVNITMLVSDIGYLIKEAEKLDIDTKEANQSLENIKAMVREGVIDKAYTQAVELNTLLNEKIIELKDALFQSEKSKLNVILEQGVQIGVSWDLDEELENIKLLTDQNEYDSATEKVRNLTSQGDEKLRKYQKEYQTLRVQKIREELEGLTLKYDEKYPKLYELIIEAEEKLSSGELEPIDTYIETFNNRKLRVEVSHMEQAIEELKSLGLQVPSDLLNQLNNLKIEGGFANGEQ